MKKLFVIPIVSTCLLTTMIGGCGDNAKSSDAVESSRQTADSLDVQVGTKKAGEATDAAANEKSGAQTETDVKKDDTANSTVDYESIYAPILDEVADIVNSGYDYDKSYKYVGNGLMEKAMYPGDKPLTETVGYVLEDISGDGIPELMIGCDEDYGYIGPQSYLFSVFSIKDNEPVQTIDGWVRNSYRWIGNGHFYYFGSGGAAYSCFGECHLNEDGTKELWDDFYLTDVKNGGDIGLYHNNTGSSESSQSEELSISEDEFWNKMDEYEARCKLLNWTHVGNSTDYEALYEPVFTEILDVIDYGYNMDREYSYASGNLTDVIDSGEKKNPLDEIGYVLEDVSGDGVPELIIGYDASYSGSSEKSYISGVYTLKNNKPLVTYAGSARSSYLRVDDTHFFFQTYGGVSLTIMGNNHLSKDGTEIVWDKCYFTDEKNDGSIGYYQNTTGIVDASKSEEMEYGEDAFVEIMSDCLEYTIRIDWTPIGKCKARGGPGATAKGNESESFVGEPYCGVLYWYKDVMDNVKSGDDVEKYSSQTALVQHGWPTATDNNEIRYEYADTNGDGCDELIITYYGDPVDIYTNEGDAVYAYGVPYRGVASIYPDGTIMEGLSMGTKGWQESWYRYDDATKKYVLVKGELNPKAPDMVFGGGKKISDVVVPDSLKGFTN